MHKSTISLTQFFWETLKPYKFYILGMLATGMYWAFSVSITPYVLKLIIDTVVEFQGDKTQIFKAVQTYLVIYVALWVAIAVDMRLVDWVRLRLLPDIRASIVQRMFGYLNRHSHHYFQNNFAGSLSNKISDMSAGVIAIVNIADDAFAQILGMIVAFSIMFFVHPMFGLVLLSWWVSFIAIAVLFFKPIAKNSHSFATSKTTLVGKVVDSISNVANVRLFSRSRYENEVIADATRDTVSKDRIMHWYLLKMRIFWDISIVVMMGINIWLLITMYSKGQVSVGDFSFIISLSSTMFFNLWYVASQFVMVAEEIGKCRQALTILTAPHDIVDQVDSKPLRVSQGRIEFHDVTFHYDEGVHLFKNKNVVIEPGQKVGLVGYSGSGKSTFVSLILRLFDVESGNIIIDGQNIKTVTQDSLRENIALIPQDITLFHRSLMDNIRYGRINASDEEVIDASKKAHCHEFISKLPEGYESLVGERGIKLSGGQRQRIAIARALLKNAPILILDEATSSLDSMTEKHIQEGLHVLMENRTTIVIAHRLSTLSEMDRILVFNEGVIIEDGTHLELIHSGGHYARMWNMQAGGFLPADQDEMAG